MATKAVPIIIAAIIGLILLVVGILVVPMMRSDGAVPVVGGSRIDSGARLEIESLRAEIEALQQQMDALRGRVSGLEVGGGGRSQLIEDEDPVNSGPNSIIDDYAKVVTIGDRRALNKGLKPASPDFLEKFLGRPRQTLSDDCDPITNAEFKKRITLEEVGPIRVRMQKPAAESIKRIFARIKTVDSDLYERISTAGSLCVRQIRGTRGRLSTHSFGLAVDLNIDGQLDRFTDGTTQLGLTIIADFFISEGWVWGAGYGREDSMHFEVSRQKLEEWRKEGKI